MYDTDLGLRAKVNDIIYERRQRWLPTNSLNLLELKNIPLINLRGGKDVTVWAFDLKNGFSINSMQENMRTRKNKMV